MLCRIAKRSFSTSKNLLQSTGSRSRLTAEPFMNGTSGVYIEQMYESWLNDHKSVHKSWDAFFSNVQAGAEPGQAFQVLIFSINLYKIFGNKGTTNGFSTTIRFHCSTCNNDTKGYERSPAHNRNSSYSG